jgi:hypothetical protein
MVIVGLFLVFQMIQGGIESTSLFLVLLVTAPYWALAVAAWWLWCTY